MLIGYARVSKYDQNLELQIDSKTVRKIRDGIAYGSLILKNGAIYWRCGACFRYYRQNYTSFLCAENYW